MILLLLTMIPSIITFLLFFALIWRLMIKSHLLQVPECFSTQLALKQQDLPMLPFWSKTPKFTQARPLQFIYSSYHLVLALTFL